MSHPDTAVMACAGRGSRLGRIAEFTPKELVHVGGLPAIIHSMHEARAAGIEKFVLVVSPGKLPAFEAIFNSHSDRLAQHARVNRHDVVDLLEDVTDLGRRTRFVIQHSPLGLGHAVMQAQRALAGKPFVLMHPDDIVVGSGLLEAMLRRHRESPAIVLGAEKVNGPDISRYGCIDPKLSAGVKLPGAAYAIRGLVEKPDFQDAPSDLALMGRFILPPEIHDAIRLSPPDKRGEMNLTDAIQALIAEEYPAEYVELLPSMGRHFDIGTEASYYDAYRLIPDARVQAQMKDIADAIDGLSPVAHPESHIWFGHG